MKELNRRYVIFFGMVVILFLLVVSYSTAINLTKECNEKKIDIENNDKVIDENICLTKTKLPLLKIAANQVKDNDFKTGICSIIEIIEEKGYISSTEVKHLLGGSGGIYSGRISFSAYYNAKAIGFPGLLFNGGPWVVVGWSARSDAQDIYGQYGFSGVYDSPHRGFAVGIGTWEYDYYIDSGWNFDASVYGFSPLILIFA
jgi:hypothetical protein